MSARTKLQLPRDHDVPVTAWLPYAVTPCCTVLAMPAALIAHHAWADQPWAAVGLTVAGAGMTGYTWLAARPRGPMVRATATGMTAAASLWALGATISGPLAHPWIDTWALGGLVMSAMVAVNRLMRRGGDEVERSAGGALGQLGDQVRALRDAKVSALKTTGARVTASIEASPGTPFSKVAAAREEIESVLDVRPGSVKLVQSPDSTRRGQVVVVPVDQLRDPITWPGPTAPGRSIADAPSVLGTVEDGEPLQLWLPGDAGRQRNNTHLLVVGMSGSGKTELLLNLAADLLTRTDAEVWVTDPRKADQLPEWLREGAHRFSSGGRAVRATIEELPALIAKRAGILGRAGHKQWVKGCGIPHLTVFFFEAAGVLMDADSIVDVAESARSVGMSLVFEVQRATYDRMPTSVRSQLGSRICLGVQQEDDATQALSEETRDAGASPWMWRDQFPGYLYAELAGTPRTRWALPARSFVAASERQRAEAIAPWLRGGQSPPPAAVVVASAGPLEADDIDEPEPPQTDNGAWDPTDPPDDVDPSQPLPEADPDAVMAFSPPPRRMTPAEAREALRTHVLLLADAGLEVVQPADLADVLEVTGRSGSWLYGQMQELCEGTDALLHHAEHGHYRIRTLVDA